MAKYAIPMSNIALRSKGMAYLNMVRQWLGTIANNLCLWCCVRGLVLCRCCVAPLSSSSGEHGMLRSRGRVTRSELSLFRFRVNLPYPSWLSSLMGSSLQTRSELLQKSPFQKHMRHWQIGPSQHTALDSKMPAAGVTVDGNLLNAPVSTQVDVSKVIGPQVDAEQLKLKSLNTVIADSETTQVCNLRCQPAH